MNGPVVMRSNSNQGRIMPCRKPHRHSPPAMSRHCVHGRPSTLFAKGQSCIQRRLAPVSDEKAWSSGECQIRTAAAAPAGRTQCPTPPSSRNRSTPISRMRTVPRSSRSVRENRRLPKSNSPTRGPNARHDSLSIHCRPIQGPAMPWPSVWLTIGVHWRNLFQNL